jgi:Uma2 family endonuclease
MAAQSTKTERAQPLRLPTINPGSTGLKRTRDHSSQWVRRGPITFDEFLELADPKLYIELVNGVVLERPMVELEHEKLFAWFFTTLQAVVNTRDLGLMVGSRTPIRIHLFGGRLPDIIFLRKERLSVATHNAVLGAPDLVIELVSPSDRPGRLIALEADYRNVGVAEIVFVDQKKRQVRVLRRDGNNYLEEELTGGTLVLETLGNLLIETSWLYDEPRPQILETVNKLLGR